MNRGRYIVGEAIDKLLGFGAGLFGSVLGLIATIVVMYLWAGNDTTLEVEKRRAHATTVSVWAGVGCLVPVVILVIVFILGAVAFTTVTNVSGPMEMPVQMPSL
jgi:hypothetical protein